MSPNRYETEEKIRVTANAVVVPTRTQQYPPHMVTKCSTITSVLNFSMNATMAANNDAHKPHTTLAQEGLVKFV